MRQSTFLIPLLLSLFLFIPAASTSGDTDRAALADEERSQAFEQRLEETQARLALSEEQIEKIVPIMRRGFERQKDILARHGIDIETHSRPAKKIKLREARKLGKEMERVRQDILKALEPVLTDEQMAEFKKIQAERKSELRQRIKQRRS